MWTLISELRDNTIHSHTHTEILVTNSNTFFATYNSPLCVRFINKCNEFFELILCRVIVSNTTYYSLHDCLDTPIFAFLTNSNPYNFRMWYIFPHIVHCVELGEVSLTFYPFLLCVRKMS